MMPTETSGRAELPEPCRHLWRPQPLRDPLCEEVKLAGVARTLGGALFYIEATLEHS